LKAVATKAPYGKGPDTIIDEQVRRAWQIEPSQVSFGDSAWPRYLAAVVRHACRELGISDDRFQKAGVHANLYKMLVYETGGHFTPHRDSEKEDGMFGTLIIQLPSPFTGGAISFEHADETKKFDLSQGSDSSFNYVAFYADCKHQIHSVESGVRLTLLYNLVASLKQELPSYSIIHETESILRSIAADWKMETGAPEHLGYQLGHKYTPKSFSAESLKGRLECTQYIDECEKPVGSPLFHIWLLMMEYSSTKQYVRGKYDDCAEIRPKFTINVTDTRRSKHSWSVCWYV
jgi:2OG-Fe(II) oxygenase superfamily